MSDCIDTAAERERLAALEGHTPGPWRVSYERGTTQIRSADNTSLMCDETYYPWVPENQNDWDIIAAAPDLKGTLATALDEIDRLREALTRIADYRAAAHAYDDDTEAPQ